MFSRGGGLRTFWSNNCGKCIILATGAVYCLFSGTEGSFEFRSSTSFRLSHPRFRNDITIGRNTHYFSNPNPKNNQNPNP